MHKELSWLNCCFVCAHICADLAFSGSFSLVTCMEAVPAYSIQNSRKRKMSVLIIKKIFTLGGTIQHYAVCMVKPFCISASCRLCNGQLSMPQV